MADAETIAKEALRHNVPEIAENMTAEQYVHAALRMRATGVRGFANGGLLNFARVVGDMALAVVPKNRFFCAVGLTSAGALGLYAGKLLAGRHLADHSPIDKTDFPRMLQPLYGKLAYDPQVNSIENTWKRLGALYTFTIISILGIVAGASYAYRNSRKRNEHPKSLEDFVARVGEKQSTRWRWMAAISGVFGSNSGYYLLPFPGLNYGSSIAAYTVLNQDRMIMTPGLKWASGTTTTSYLGLREGLDYLCKYAVHNPGKDPEEMEYLALTVLGPLAAAASFPLQAKHIKGFVDKVHEVRDKYWQEGGIPGEKKQDAMKDMEAHFRGAGLDKTLWEIGFDTMNVDFLRLKGVLGKVANVLGAKDQVIAEQRAYHDMADKWREEWLEHRVKPLKEKEAPAGPEVVAVPPSHEKKHTSRAPTPASSHTERTTLHETAAAGRSA